MGPGAAPRLQVVDVLRAGIPAWRQLHQPTPEQARLLRDLKRCRTAALGGHDYACPDCGEVVAVFNSCQNRCCPNCQALEQARWIKARERIMLPCGHYHVVFTLPAQLRPLAGQHPRELYGLLLAASADTLNTLAAEVHGIRLGTTIVLHTWRRDLERHLHTHCIVTAGGLTPDGRWVDRSRYLFPVARLRAHFRARIVAGLERWRQQGLWLTEREWRTLLCRLPRARKWVIHIEAPQGRSTHVVRYLGRYAHRIAIADSRLVAFDGKTVTFTTRDGKQTQLPTLAFTTRFLLHVLPCGFCKIRHYGLYAPALRPQLKRARQLLPPPPPAPAPSTAAADADAEPGDLDPDQPRPVRRCPVCRTPLILIADLPPVRTVIASAPSRGPPS